MNQLSKASRGLVRNVRTKQTNIFWTTSSSTQTARSVVNFTCARMRTGRTKTNRPKVKMLNMTERRMAFYARILSIDGELTLNEEDAKEWRRDLPDAIEAQHRLIDRGALPVVMSLENVRTLKRRLGKTFD